MSYKTDVDWLEFFSFFVETTTWWLIILTQRSLIVNHSASLGLSGPDLPSLVASINELS